MDQQGIRILIVEDEEDDVVLLKYLIRLGIKDMGVIVDPATSFSEAISHLDRARHDVCLFGRKLDREDAWDLLRAIQAKDPSPPLIFLTEPGDEDIAGKNLKVEISHHLDRTKLSPELLCQSIRCTVELR